MSNGCRAGACAWLIVGVAAIASAATAAGVDHRQRDQEKNDQEHRRPDHDRERYLFVCAGDQAREAPDFMAVIDFDPSSASYGKVLATVPFPASSASGNEPHHVGLSSDGRTLACGGLLSVLKGQKEIFFFDVTRPTAPRFIRAADPPLSAITDEFHPLPGGGFLVTMMGGPQGHHPGRVAEFDASLQLVAEHPKSPPDDGFNPHGISVRPELNLMVTSDFICPSTTLHAVPGDLDLRGSIRVWSLRSRRIVRTIPIPGAGGTIDVQLIPGDRRARAYTAGMLDDKLYLVDTRAGRARPVFDFSTIAKGGWPQLMRMTRDGTRLFVSMNVAGRVAMLDTSDPSRPTLIATADLGADSGPHYLTLTRDERRLVVSDYFLNEDDFGKVHQEGDHKVHVLSVRPDTLTLDPAFYLDFNTAFPAGPARPHGLALK
jgi:56kDa selenium binding protein (SBP56)